jgi:hypothetical protein
MTAEEQKWLVESLGGKDVIVTRYQILLRLPEDDEDDCRSSLALLITPNGYEWVRQQLLKKNLLHKFVAYYQKTTEARYIRPWHRTPLCQWEYNAPAEKSKLIHDFLKERE